MSIGSGIHFSLSRNTTSQHRPSQTSNASPQSTAWHFPSSCLHCDMFPATLLCPMQCCPGPAWWTPTFCTCKRRCWITRSSWMQQPSRSSRPSSLQLTTQTDAVSAAAQQCQQSQQSHCVCATHIHMHMHTCACNPCGAPQLNHPYIASSNQTTPPAVLPAAAAAGPPGYFPSLCWRFACSCCPVAAGPGRNNLLRRAGAAFDKFGKMLEVIPEGEGLGSPLGKEVASVLLKVLLPNHVYCQRGTVDAFQGEQDAARVPNIGVVLQGRVTLQLAKPPVQHPLMC